MFSTYVIKSITSSKYYIGSTENIEKRLDEHNSGKNQYTRYRGPWKLAYQEKFPTRSEALIREKQIKSYKGGNAFKMLLINNIG